jgi:hypothetical protein
VTTNQSAPDLSTPAATIDDPQLLLARIGYRAYLTFRGDGSQGISVADDNMTADLDRLTELLEPPQPTAPATPEYSRKATRGRSLLGAV